MLLSRCASSLLPVFAVAGKFWRTLQTWLIVSLSINLPGVALGVDREPAADTFARAARTFLEAYCFECHGHGASEADVDLQQLTTRPHDRSSRDTWLKVMQQLRAGTMPPADHAPRPAVRLSARFVERIDKRFFHVDCDQVHDPGRVTIRRLNQTEYENTIRDLLGVPFTAAETFPRDGVGYGFDNIGDVLSLPPALLEKYLAAAATISRDVVYTGEEADLRRRRYSAAALKATPNAGAALEDDYLLLNREGGAAYATFHPYIAGDYLLRVRAFGVQPSGGPMRMAIRVADETVADVEIEGHRRLHDFEFPLAFGGGDLPLGWRDIYIVYLDEFVGESEVDRDLALLEVELEGPLHLEGHTYPFPPPHRRVIRVQPDEGHSVANAARVNLSRLAERAFRRPVRPEDVDSYVSLVTSAVQRGESFEQAMQFGLQAVLVSPQFLFRVELPSRPDDAKHVDAVGQFELASRLSYFLWSTMPDEELFEAARRGNLARRDELLRQVERMLASPKSTALVDNFAGQWLQLRNLSDVRPHRPTFPDYNEQLARDMQRETQLLVEHVFREDQSLLELLSAEYTFINQRLAEHYGLPGVSGDGFRRVSLAGVPRRGVLTQASILTLTSDPARTLPVKRGRWILETILGSAPPPPPPDVPPLDRTAKAHPDGTLREQLARHRQDAKCIGCHETMDPVGLAFEQYDAIGRWRAKIGEQPVDTAGALPDGRRFDDALELIDLLRERKTEFAKQVTRAMLTYALGRGLEPYDQCAVETILAAVEQDGYRSRTLVREIVLSDPFRMRRGDGGMP